jgi:hypothetical protein
MAAPSDVGYSAVICQKFQRGIALPLTRAEL